MLEKLNQLTTRHLLTGLFLISVSVFFSSNAFAARTIDSATVDGSSTTSVSAGATITASVTVTTDGNGSNNDWKSTGWLIAGASGTLICSDHADNTSPGTYTESFTITAPALAGTYNVYFVAFRKDDCTGGPSAEFTLPGAVIVGGVISACSIFLDDFATQGYANQAGTAFWTSNWSEIGDDGSATGGTIEISGGQLQLEGNGSVATFLGGPYVEREANLSNFTSATLSFDYRETGDWEGNDDFEIYVSADGGTSWNLIHTFSNDQGDIFQNFSQDITAYIATNTRIAFVEKANANDEIFYIDNVQIEACGSTTDHLSIGHDGTAVNCQAENITISAHTNSTLPHVVVSSYTGTVLLTTDTSNGDWSYVSGGNPANLTNLGNGAGSYIFDGSESGSVVLGLANTFPETISINVSDGSISETSGVADATDDPFLAYAQAGFQYLGDSVANNIGLQIAGKPSDTGYGSQLLQLEAINTNLVTGACEAALAGSVSIELAFECRNATTCQRPIYIGGTSASDLVTGTDNGNPMIYTTVSLDFGDPLTTTADFVMNYPDAGEIQLHTRYLPATENLLGSSNQFVSRPFGFALSAEVNPGPFANPAAMNENGPVFTSAGNPFTVNSAGALWNFADDLNVDGIPDSHDDTDPSLQANLADNIVTLGVTSYQGTPNFGQELEDLELFALLDQPAGGNDPGFPVGTLIGSFAGGAGSNTSVQYAEVGIIEISAAIDDGDYLGIGTTETDKMTSRSGYVGRFIPASFGITINSDGVLADVCGTYTYIGEDFNYSFAPSITVTALNTSGMTTTNYRDAFVKLTAASVSVDASQDDTTPGSDTNPLLVSYIAAAMTPTANNDGTVSYVFGADTYRYGPDLPLTTFSKFPNSQVAPFIADINPDISAVSDTEVTTNFPALTHVLDPAGNNLRFGRLRMTNTHGSELTPLLMPAVTEFWNGTGFEINVLDTCTSIALTDLVSVASPPGLSVPTIINSPALAGDIGITFPAPGAGNVGFIDTTTNLSTSGDLALRFDWDNNGDFDNDPNARATFGIFSGNDVNIYKLQIYQ